MLSRARAAKTTGALVALYVLWRNVQIENSAGPVPLGFYEATLHAVVFLLRLLVNVPVQRLVGINAHLPRRAWWVQDEISMRAANFAAKISFFDLPNSFVNMLGRHSRLALTLAGCLHVEDVPAHKLGFGTPAAHAKFGRKTECSALWITLNHQQPIPFSQVDNGNEDVKVIFYAHGGGFCIGNAAMYLTAMCKLLTTLRDECGITNVGILSLEYPLAPQVKHPVPTDQCFFVYDYLVRQTGKIKPHNVVLAGDSAGGSIALTIALKATRWGVAGACLFSPWVAHDLETASHVEFENVDLIGGRLGIEQYQDAHVQGGRDVSVRDDTLHVLNKQLPFSELPPILISCGEYEVFKDDVVSLASELQAVGNQVSVEMHLAPKMPHVFPMLYPLFFAESGPALDKCARFCARQWELAKEEAARLELGTFKEEKARVDKLKRDLSLTDLGEIYQMVKESEM